MAWHGRRQHGRGQWEAQRMKEKAFSGSSSPSPKTILTYHPSREASILNRAGRAGRQGTLGTNSCVFLVILEKEELQSHKKPISACPSATFEGTFETAFYIWHCIVAQERGETEATLHTATVGGAGKQEALTASGSTQASAECLVAFAPLKKSC